MVESRDSAVSSSEQQLTREEAEVYDRQIRLWGMDAQNRIRNSSVLVAGLNGLGSEVVKNLVLVGIKAITLQDECDVTEQDHRSQLLLAPDCVGKNRASASQARTQELNPMVSVAVEQRPLSEFTEKHFETFDLVCLVGKSYDECLRVNEICRKQGKMFFCSSAWGSLGYFFSDLGDHEFVAPVRQAGSVDVSGNGTATPSVPTGDGPPQPSTTSREEDDGEPVTKKARLADGQAVPGGQQERDTETTDLTQTDVMVKQEMSFVSLKSAMSTNWALASKRRKLRRFPKSFFKIPILNEFRLRHSRDPSKASMEHDEAALEQIRAEFMKRESVPVEFPEDFAKNCLGILNPVCAVTGGVLAQEIIRAVSRNHRPHQNVFLYDFVDSRNSCGVVLNLPLVVD